MFQNSLEVYVASDLGNTTHRLCVHGQSTWPFLASNSYVYWERLLSYSRCCATHFTCITHSITTTTVMKWLLLLAFCGWDESFREIKWAGIWTPMVYSFWSYPQSWLFFFLLNVYFWERENERGSRVGAERETESEAGSRLWAVTIEPDMGLRPTDWDHDLSWSRTLNQLSHPDAPK